MTEVVQTIDEDSVTVLKLDELLDFGRYFFNIKEHVDAHLVSLIWVEVV